MGNNNVLTIARTVFMQPTYATKQPSWGGGVSPGVETKNDTHNSESQNKKAHYTLKRC